MNGFGVIPEIVEPIRNYDYEIVCGAAEDTKEYPKIFEIDRNLATLKSQGAIGACVAETIAQIAEAYFGQEMSEGYAYGKFRKNELTGSGLIVSQALEFWRKLGTVPKQYFSKLTEMPDIRKLVNSIPELDNLAKQFPISGYASLNYADKKKKDNLIKEALTTTSKSYGLLAVSDSYFSESHCIWLTGWNDETNSYKIKNSWGKNWGDNGFGEIPKGEVNAVYAIFFDGIKLPFEDVQPSDWFYGQVKNMYLAGLMSGTSDKTFEPNKPMTRAELATFGNNLLRAVDERNKILNSVLIMLINELKNRR